MSRGHSRTVLGQIRSLFGGGTLAGLGEGALLDRFVAGGDGEAFEALMARHGPMVLGVCRRVLDDPSDVEDAFQATFLVLVQKAGSLRDRELLANWLYGVAHRVAARVRSGTYRRRARERSGGEEAAVARAIPEGRAELRAVIDDEVARLPLRLREAVVLCELEGLSQSDAAARIGCPVGTVKSRLSRARERLRGRLVRRGVAPAALAAGWFAVPQASSAAVPASLQASTIRAATQLAAGAAVSTQAASLIDGVTKSMTMVKLKPTGFLMLLLAAAGAVEVASRPILDDPPKRAGPPHASAVTAPTAADVPRSGGRTIVLNVVRKADGRPVPGASVEVQSVGFSSTIVNGTTDEAGRFRVEVAAWPSRWVTVGAFRDGFVPAQLTWSRAELDASRPETATIELEPGTAAGGIVRDEAGRPIAGAKVIPYLTDGAAGAARSFFSPEGGVATTDRGGRWQASFLPADAEGPLMIRLSHPDYVSETSGYSRRLSLDQVRSTSGVLVMKPGIAVGGTVVGPEGRPVAGASVVLSATMLDRHWTTADAEGRFRFAHVEHQPESAGIFVQAEAAGFAPGWVRAESRGDLPSVRLVLVPGRPFRGRVVDVNGLPVAGAEVSILAWEKCGQLDWRAETDAEGRFTWADAPKSGDLMLNVAKLGYSAAFGRRVALTDADPVVVLNPPLRVRGSVVDAETGRPIDAFKIDVGQTYDPRGGDVRYWEYVRSGAGPRGRYEYSPGEDQGMTRLLRVEAEGYRPSISRPIAQGEGEIVVDFQLRKATDKLADLAGLVRGPDGTPLAGAAVFLATRSRRLRLQNGRPDPAWLDPGMTMETGRDGRFAFRPPGERASVVVLHDLGFAQRDANELAGSPELTIEAWARIEGVVRVGAKPGAGQSIRVEDHRSILLEGHGQAWHYRAEADEGGRFLVDRVMPSDRVRVQRQVGTRLGGLAATSTPPLDIRPGETVRVEIGGTGRPILGRLVGPEGAATPDFSYARGTVNLRLPEIARPDGFAGWEARRREQYLAKFWESPEGRERSRRSRSYAFRISTEGTFRVEDVPAGSYDLVAVLLSDAPPYSETATARILVEVAEMDGGRSDQPLDVGSLTLVPGRAATPKESGGVPSGR